MNTVKLLINAPDVYSNNRQIPPAFNGDPAFIRTIGKYPPVFNGDPAFIRSFMVAVNKKTRLSATG